FCSLARPRGLPASSLFPYTTLFRSDWRGALEAEARAIETEDLAANRAMGVLGASLVVPGSGVLTHCNTGSLATAGFGTALGVIRDRKSTRLNSSHVKISYAVFCLKK